MQKLSEALRTVSAATLVYARLIMAKENTLQTPQQATIWKNSRRGLQEKWCYISEVFFSASFQLFSSFILSYNSLRSQELELGCLV